MLFALAVLFAIAVCCFRHQIELAMGLIEESAMFVFDSHWAIGGLLFKQLAGTYYSSKFRIDHEAINSRSFFLGG